MSRRRSATWLAHPIAIIILAAIAFEIVGQFTTDPPGAVADIGYFLLLLVTTAVGWLLAWKRPRHPLGWLLLAVPALFILQAPAQALGDAVHAGAPAVAAWAYWATSDWTWVPPVGLLFTQIPLRFPDGRLPSVRWRWFSWFTIFSIVAASWLISTRPARFAHGLANPTYLPWTSTDKTILTILVFSVLLGPSFVGSIISLFVRYRRADSIARAQLRWVFWGVAIPIGLLILNWLLPQVSIIGGSLLLATYALIPIAIGVAVMRYGLYGIDRIISRTVSYAIVTIVIVGVYAGLVLGIGALLPKATSVGVAIATLAAAAVFLPLLRRVQAWVDRRFNRAAYDAQKVVEAFGEELRNGADPHTASTDLLAAVAQTLQPTSLGVWSPKSDR
jgi:hypothetical protein